MNQPPNFDRLARPYRWMEWLSFGPWLMLTRTAFLPETDRACRALILGDGDGRFTARLLRRNPRVTVDALDASNAMLAQLRRRAGAHANRVTIHVADARNWQAPPLTEPYDLIATHFFLDCFTGNEVQALAMEIARVCDPSARWIVSDFAIPESLFGKLVARPMVSTLYWAFRVLTGLAVRALPDHGAALKSAGFVLRERRTRLHGLLASELWTASRDGAFDSPISSPSGGLAVDSA